MNIRRSTSIMAGLLLASALAVAACGSSSAPGSSGAPGGGSTSRPSVGLPGNLPAVGGGSCTVNVTGDVTASWTDQQDMSSVLITYWLGDSERAVLKMSPGEESFLFNCQSDQGTISMYSTTDTTAAQFPKAPGSYVIAAAGLLGGGDAGQVSALVTVGKDTIWKIAEPGTLNITTFNGSKFAGTFQAKIQKLGDDLSTVVATATLSGTFEFGCTAGGCG